MISRFASDQQVLGTARPLYFGDCSDPQALDRLNATAFKLPIKELIVFEPNGLGLGYANFGISKRLDRLDRIAASEFQNETPVLKSKIFNFQFSPCPVRQHRRNDLKTHKSLGKIC